jgi:hypothetical protein
MKVCVVRCRHLSKVDPGSRASRQMGSAVFRGQYTGKASRGVEIVRGIGNAGPGEGRPAGLALRATATM